MTVIAVREFGVGNGGLDKAELRIHAPTQRSKEEWICEYELCGFSKSRVRATHGGDSYQALVLALKVASVDVMQTEEYKSGLLTQFGEQFEIEYFKSLP